MTVRYRDSLSGNDRYLHKQLHRIVGAKLGPVSVGPGDGQIRMHNDSGDTFVLSPVNGATAFPGGVKTHLNSWMEWSADTLGKHDSRLGKAEGRLDGHDSTLASHGSRLGKAEGRLDGHDSTLSSHGSRLGSIESKNGQQDTRLTNIESKNRSQDSSISGLSSRVSSLEGKATATPGQVSDLKSYVDSQDASIRQLITSLTQRVAAIEARLRS